MLMINFTRARVGSCAKMLRNAPEEEKIISRGEGGQGNRARDDRYAACDPAGSQSQETAEREAQTDVGEVARRERPVIQIRLRRFCRATRLQPLLTLPANSGYCFREASHTDL